jgi:hypothetical protein
MKKNCLKITLILAAMLPIMAQAQKLVPERIRNNDPDLAAVYSDDVAGGWHQVADLAARNALPADKRRVGMSVTYFDGLKYISERFVGTNTLDIEWTNNANWQELAGAITAGKLITNNLDTFDLGGYSDADITFEIEEATGRMRWDIHDIPYNVYNDAEIANTGISSQAYDDANSSSALLVAKTSGVNSSVYLQSANGSGTRKIDISTSLDPEITDGITSKGLTYNADYSTAGLLDPRWIPDITAVRKEIGDSVGAVAAGNNGDVQLNNSNALGVAGDISTDWQLRMAANKLEFGELNNYTAYFTHQEVGTTTTPLQIGGYSTTNSEGFEIFVSTSGSGIYSSVQDESGNRSDYHMESEGTGESSLRHYWSVDTAGDVPQEMEFNSIGLKLNHADPGSWTDNYVITKGYANANYAGSGGGVVSQNKGAFDTITFKTSSLLFTGAGDFKFGQNANRISGFDLYTNGGINIDDDGNGVFIGSGQRTGTTSGGLYMTDGSANNGIAGQGIFLDSYAGPGDQSYLTVDSRGDGFVELGHSLGGKLKVSESGTLFSGANVDIQDTLTTRVFKVGGSDPVDSISTLKDAIHAETLDKINVDTVLSADAADTVLVNEMALAIRKILRPNDYTSYLPIDSSYTTPVLTVNTPTKVLIPTALKYSRNWSFFDKGGGDLALRFDGTDSSRFHISMTTSMTTSTSNVIVKLYMYKNGVVEPGIAIARKVSTGTDTGALSIVGAFDMDENDYVEIYAEVDVSCAITFTLTSIIIKEDGQID